MNFIRHRIFYFFILLAAGLLAAVYWKKAVSTEKQDVLPMATFCDDLQEGLLQWSAVVKHSNTASPEMAAREQIKFLDGWFHFAAPGQPRLVLLHDLFVKIESVKKVDSNTTLISYSAEKPVTFCKVKGKEISKIELHLPYDPFLAYDLVPENQRRMLSFHGEKIRTNPCADPEIVINSRPDHYWYTWQPQAHGTDALGQTYDCRTLLKAGTDYQIVEGRFLPQVKKEVKNAFEPLAGTKRLKAALVFGFVSGEPEDRTLNDAKKFFATQPQGSASIFQSKREQDAAVWAVTDFFAQLKKIADFDGYEVMDRGDHLRLSASVTLKSSKRVIDVEVFLGSTEVESKTAGNFLAEVLENSQLVFYIGHSGAGTRIDWSAMRARFPAQQPYQVLGIIGCYSTEYFNPVYVDFRKAQSLTTILLRTDFGGYRYLLPLGVLSYLDQLQEPRRVSLNDSLTKYLEAGENVLVQWF